MKVINKILDKIMPYKIFYGGHTFEREKIEFNIPKINLRFFTKKAQERQMQTLQENKVITKYYYSEGKNNIVDRVLDNYIFAIDALFN